MTQALTIAADSPARSTVGAVGPDSIEAPVQAAGKFLSVADRTFLLRGVTYGPFAPEQNGSEYHTPARVAHDFAAIARHGFNTVRTYTPPPSWVLDIAADSGLRVFVGVPWEQHVTFLDTKRQRDDIVARVRNAVAVCERHPAVLGYAVGNEIPPSITRWYGRRRIERFVGRLYEAAKSQHPDALVTYVNFPTTEYLELPFLDFYAWNVYLESPATLAAYVARLQNLAGEKPLVLAEVGLDSASQGEQRQAEVLDWQIRTLGDAGCAGAIVFSWTDEWFRSGQEILDWSFGLTDRERRPKPALEAVTRAFDASFPASDERHEWPLVSVVVCTYNGSRTLRETLEALVSQLDYPRYEVIVVNDGSTDGSAAIAAEYPVRLLTTTNRGLSHARNVGLRHALGDIVAYIDDDAYPHPLWLRHLVHTFLATPHVGVGGPNVCPPSDSETAQCVSHAPGGPNHVLLSDTVAEHIPGCNMAFRREALLAVGGFDERFRIAGDDVDLCWRLQENGGTLGYSPAAMVWHHSRSTLRGYLRQQYNYGRAEAMLEAKWPAKYNSVGYPRWEGRIYGRSRREPLPRRWAIYHGVWGSNLFQTLYVRPPGTLGWIPLLPEWYALIALFAFLSLLSVVWAPLTWSLGPLLLVVGVQVGQAMAAARRSMLGWRETDRLRRYRERTRIALLHLLQPAVRLGGRLDYGLHPLRRTRGVRRLSLPRLRVATQWCETWRAAEARLETLERRLRKRGARVRRGGAFDDWDLEVRGGLFGGIRLLMAIEEHGQGRQLVRVRSWPFLERWTLPLAGILTGLTAVAAADRGLTTAAAFGAAGLLLSGCAIFDCAGASSVASSLELADPPNRSSRPDATELPGRDRTQSSELQALPSAAQSPIRVRANESSSSRR